MTFAKITTALAAIAVSTPALAHPGHGLTGHIHWEFVAVVIVVAAGAIVLRRRVSK